MTSKIGTCTKCNAYGKVVMHHAHGYEGDNKDNVQPYCNSCHIKIHRNARKSGKCNIPKDKIIKLSRNSAQRRFKKDKRKQLNFTETLIPNIMLMEKIFIFPNQIQYSAFFKAVTGKKICFIDCD